MARFAGLPAERTNGRYLRSRAAAVPRRSPAVISPCSDRGVAGPLDLNQRRVAAMKLRRCGAVCVRMTYAFHVMPDGIAVPQFPSGGRAALPEEDAVTEKNASRKQAFSRLAGSSAL